MNPRELLVFAKKIAGVKSGPAECRRAISGAYYAVYHVVVDFLDQQAGLQPHQDKHKGVKGSLLFCKNEDARKLGVKLDTLHTERKKADYDLSDGDPEEQKTVMAACKLSEEIITGLNGFAPEHTANIVNGMKAYAAKLGPMQSCLKPA